MALNGEGVTIKDRDWSVEKNAYFEKVEPVQLKRTGKFNI